MGKLRRCLSILAIGLLLPLVSALPAWGLDQVDTRTVRVGFYYAEGFHVMDDSGKRSGYAYEVLQAMKLYADWNYEYIGYDKGWADIQQMILDGEIDMVVSAVKTPARMEIYDFSDRPIGQSGACLMVKAGVSPYTAGDYASYNNMRIGFIENASQIATTEAFAAEKGFTYTPVYYKTSAELEAAILSGAEVDAIVTSNMRIIAGTRRLELYAMQDVHAMVQKGNKELLKEINYALEQISLYNSGLYDSLYNKYYSVDAGDAVFFDPEESELINECREEELALRLALAPDMSPYSYYNEEGQPTGILYDIASEALRRTGLDWEIVTARSDAEYRDLLESRAVDLQMTARFDYNYGEERGYTLTSPYYSADVSRVTRKEFSGEINTIATVEKSIIESYYLPQIVEDENIVFYPSVADCVEAVLKGDCDAVYLFTRTAQEAVYTDVTNRLTSAIMPNSAVGFSFGVREEMDSRLSSILEKAVISLSDEEIAGLVIGYTDYATQPLTFRSILYSNPIFALSIMALVLILVFAAVLLAANIRKQRREREQNTRLQAALSSAEQANLAKSVFMSRMSHEIRTPLNAIIGYNSISATKLSEAKTEPEYRQATMNALDCLAKSDIASKHLLTVINDVLDMSAIESGKIKISREPFDFKSMISGLTVMFYSQAKAKGVTFEVVLDSLTEEWFVGDQMRLNQVFANLLSNAIKFTPHGGRVRLAISQPESQGHKAQISFEVSDTGIGMSQEFLSAMWTPFEQEDASISRRFGGTGLGLSITKNLLDLMGGKIQVQSELGVGSTFKVDVYLERMEQPVREYAFDFSGIRVLVADDDVGTCDYLNLLFRRSGVSCTTVTSGTAAVAEVVASLEQNNPYAVCIIDWHMPDPDGLATVKRIRQIVGAELPIIVISAYDFSEIEYAAREAGVNSFVAKPLFQSTVFDLLANLSGKHKQLPLSKLKSYDFQGARILLAEDNQMNMEIAKAILTFWNLHVDEAWNGQEAVAMFCTAPAGTYKAILMDVHMPEMDGYRATQTIRGSEHPEAASIPIIAMTADVFAEDVAEALAAGMNAHIGKPINKSTLLDTLCRYIG